jgi:hypothetical protein
MLGYGAISDGAIADNPAAAAAGYTLTAEAGSFALAGQAVALPRSYRLAVEPGGFALAGSDVALAYSGAATQGPVANGGSQWAWSEFRTVPLDHYRLKAEPGAFVLRGGSVQFRRGINPGVIRRRRFAAALLLAA